MTGKYQLSFELPHHHHQQHRGDVDMRNVWYDDSAGDVYYKWIILSVRKLPNNINGIHVNNNMQYFSFQFVYNIVRMCRLSISPNASHVNAAYLFVFCTFSAVWYSSIRPLFCNRLKCMHARILTILHFTHAFPNSSSSFVYCLVELWRIFSQCFSSRTESSYYWMQNKVLEINDRNRNIFSYSDVKKHKDAWLRVRPPF